MDMRGRRGMLGEADGNASKEAAAGIQSMHSPCIPAQNHASSCLQREAWNCMDGHVLSV